MKPPIKMKRCPRCKGDGFILRKERWNGQWSLKPFPAKCEKCFGTGLYVKLEPKEHQ